MCLYMTGHIYIYDNHHNLSNLTGACQPFLTRHLQLETSPRFAAVFRDIIAISECVFDGFCNHMSIMCIQKCGYSNNKPSIWEWFIQPIYGEIGDGLLLFNQHYSYILLTILLTHCMVLDWQHLLVGSSLLFVQVAWWMYFNGHPATDII